MHVCVCACMCMYVPLRCPGAPQHVWPALLCFLLLTGEAVSGWHAVSAAFGFCSSCGTKSTPAGLKRSFVCGTHVA